MVLVVDDPGVVAMVGRRPVVAITPFDFLPLTSAVAMVWSFDDPVVVSMIGRRLELLSCVFYHAFPFAFSIIAQAMVTSRPWALHAPAAPVLHALVSSPAGRDPCSVGLRYGCACCDVGLSRQAVVTVCELLHRVQAAVEAAGSRRQ